MPAILTHYSKSIQISKVQMEKLRLAEKFVEFMWGTLFNSGVPVRVCGPASDWCGSVPPVGNPFNQHTTEQPQERNKTTN